MASRTKKRRNGMSRAGRKRRADSRRAKEAAEQKIAARRERRINAFKSFGRRAAAALFVCGALAVGVNSNDNGTGFSGKEKEEKPAAKASPIKESAGQGGFGSGNEVFLALGEGPRELTLTNNDYSEGWEMRPNPWARAKPLLDKMGNAGGEEERAEGGENPGMEGRGKSEKGKGGKAPKRERRKPWRADWEHLDALPARRMRKFKMDPLKPEDGEGD